MSNDRAQPEITTSFRISKNVSTRENINSNKRNHTYVPTRNQIAPTSTRANNNNNINKRNFIYVPTQHRVPTTSRNSGNNVLNVKNANANNYDDDEDLNDCSNENFPFSTALRRILENTFKIRNYNGMQLAVINSIMLEKNVFFLAPTGSGKSLTFKITAIASEGTTIIISPLVELIRCQVEELQQLNVNAVAVTSATPQNEMVDIIENLYATNSTIKLVYITPEQATAFTFTTVFKKMYQEKRIARFVFDECHVIDEWKIFRVSYGELGDWIKKFGSTQIVVLTATAEKLKIGRIIRTLNMGDSTSIILSPENRTNIQYRVLSKPGPNSFNKYLADKIKAEHLGHSGIVYCHTRVGTEKLSEYLNEQGLQTSYYHSKVHYEERKKRYVDWKNNATKIMCATTAFGMGIHKPDVKFVYFATIPRSMSQFVQGAGRAGRNGDESECVIMFNRTDKKNLFTEIHSTYNDANEIETLQRDRELHEMNAVNEFCIQRITCRRMQIASHFNLNMVKCTNIENTKCDNCALANVKKFMRIDITLHSKNCVSVMEQLKEQNINITFNQLKLLFGQGNDSKRNKCLHLVDEHTRHILSVFENDEIASILDAMMDKGIIAQIFKRVHRYRQEYVELKNNYAQIINDHNYRLSIVVEDNPRNRNQKFYNLIIDDEEAADDVEYEDGPTTSKRARYQ